jgi:NADPH:quinone reductase-like Zn-dependent oxidoreductase
MHAIRMRNFGPPLEILEFVELPEPSAPGPDEVLNAPSVDAPPNASGF